MQSYQTTFVRKICKKQPAELELIVDNFAGAGGASLGIEAALNQPVDIAINHSRTAITLHTLNHPVTRHYQEDVWQVDPIKATGGRPVGLAWFSPDCTHFSRAKGGKPRDKKIRALAWVVIRWAKAVRPRVVILENVDEFKTWGPLDKSGIPIKTKAGATFQAWLNCLIELGYRTEYRTLIAADYGTPTIRKRFFLIARCDGEPIVWPARTHAPRTKATELGIKPWPAAAECIDWSIPCKSIFERKKPLAEATLQRIARGLKKFLFNCADPFIISVSHTKTTGRGKYDDSIHDPLKTICASNDKAVVEPFIVCCNHSGKSFRGQSIDDPMNTVTGSRDANGIVVPYLSSFYGQSNGSQINNPIPSQSNKEHTAEVAAFLQKYHGQKGNETRAADPTEPLATQDTSNRFAITQASIIKFRRGATGSPATEPMPTITGGGATIRPAGAAHATGIVNTNLIKLYGTCKDGSPITNPIPTITGSGTHIAEIRAFLLKYFGTGTGQSTKDPLHTITEKDHFGIVTIKNQDYQIVDIGLRMLEPKELLRAQFGRFADEYILTGTKADQVSAIGNSVPPELAEAIVKANVKLQKINTGEQL